MADVSGAGLRARHALLSPTLNERQRRFIAAADARLLGHGGIARLSRATGLSRTTLHKGLSELKGASAEGRRREKAAAGKGSGGS